MSSASSDKVAFLKVVKTETFCVFPGEEDIGRSKSTKSKVKKRNVCREVYVLFSLFLLTQTEHTGEKYSF